MWDQFHPSSWIFRSDVRLDVEMRPKHVSLLWIHENRNRKDLEEVLEEVVFEKRTILTPPMRSWRLRAKQRGTPQKKFFGSHIMSEKSCIKLATLRLAAALPQRDFLISHCGGGQIVNWTTIKRSLNLCKSLQPILNRIVHPHVVVRASIFNDNDYKNESINDLATA